MSKKSEEKSKKESGLILLRNIKRTLKIFWEISPRSLIFLVLTIIFISTLPFATSYVYGLLFNAIVEYLAGNDAVKNDIFILFGISIGLGALLNIFFRLNSFVDRLAYFDWHEKLAHKVTEKLSNLDIEKYEDPKFNTLLSKVRDGYDYKPANFASSTIWLLNDIIQILTSLVIMVTLSPFLLPIIFISSIPEFLITIKGSKLKWGIWDAKGEVNKMYWAARGDLTSETEIKEVRILGARSYLLNFASTLKKEFLDEQRGVLKREGLFAFGAKFIEIIVGALVELWLLLKVLARTNNFGIGDYSFYLNTIRKFGDASRNILRNISQMYENNLFMDDLYKLLDIENKISVKPNAVVVSTDKVPFIEFRNVSFKYPKTKNYIYKDFSIKIEPGEDIALVGENGAGKTTFVKLLCRFYDVKEGEILINGTNIKDLDLESWYRNVGVLFQDFNKYAYSARKNIFLGDVTKEDDLRTIVEVSKNAGAHSMINKFTGKYDQILSKWFEKGTDLSGGQWQRVALARAFFRNANILILDEPTSAIDAKGEYEIFKKIAEVQKDKTTIIISHRFSTVKKAHKIYVIDEGKIIEQGTHEDLMKVNEGKYKEMFELQAEGYK
jgi:ABC-type multidrug transport system fused ATPase/permease subunit